MVPSLLQVLQIKKKLLLLLIIIYNIKIIQYLFIFCNNLPLYFDAFKLFAGRRNEATVALVNDGTKTKVRRLHCV